MEKGGQWVLPYATNNLVKMLGMNMPQDILGNMESEFLPEVVV